VYKGALSMRERAARLAAFKGDERAVLVATRAGTEGLNLQFCNVLVNYELPWNPMIVEQRIGRIHRIGQTREAQIINLAAAGTIEEHVLRLLDQKIRLFELVVGELDVILGEFGGAESLEDELADAWLGAESDEAFEQRVEAMGERIVASREAGLAQERLNSEMAADDNAMRLERDFARLALAERLRLGYGTGHLVIVPACEAKRHRLGIHVEDVIEVLEDATERKVSPEDAGQHPVHGPLRRIGGTTSVGRTIRLIVHGDRLPMTMLDIEADA
jgi:superfamily II DNA/RNA helicase